MNIQIEKNNLELKAISNDGDEIGALTVASEGFGMYRIEYMEINPKYRGKGYYRQILAAAFDAFKMDILYSFNRNDLSNGIYRLWTGNSDLSGDHRVWIERLNGCVSFTID